MLPFQNFNLLKNKKIEDLMNIRAIALAADGKIKANNLGDFDCMQLLRLLNGEPDNRIAKYEIPEYLVSNIREKWLLDISIENGVVRIQSIAQTDNWVKEMVEQEIYRYWQGFGGCDFTIVCKQLGLEADYTEIGEYFDWAGTQRRVKEIWKMRAETCAALYKDIEESSKLYTARLEAIVNEGK